MSRRHRSTGAPGGLLVVTDSAHSSGHVIAGLVTDHRASCVLLDPVRAERLVQHLVGHRARLGSLGSMADEIAALVHT